MLLWGTCATFLGAVRSREQLWAVRFLLGVTKAGFAVSSALISSILGAEGLTSLIAWSYVYV